MQKTSDQIIQNINKINEYYKDILLHLLDKSVSSLPPELIINEGSIKLFKEIGVEIFSKPQATFENAFEYLSSIQKLISKTFDKFLNNDNPSIYKQKLKGDKRFKNTAFEDNIYFNFVKEFYLITSDSLKTNLNKLELDKSSYLLLEFITKQFIEALSPTNFIPTNPDVLKKGLETGWQSVVDGLENFLSDLKQSKDIFCIPTANKQGFCIGKNIAQTTGKVVYQNELIELIFYEPEITSFELPLLMIPPWINKYYILDLSPHNSLASYLSKANLKIFMISWRNIDQKDANLDFEDYLKLGVLAAYKFLNTIGYKYFNAAGYCIGGTLLAASLSYLKKNNLNCIRSASLIAALLDYSNVGDLSLFVNKTSIDQLENIIKAKGYLDGRYLFNGFSILRSNDLIWSFVINNYLLGLSPPSFDILYWNADVTNLSAHMCIYYLRNMYIKNLLIETNALSLLGTSIDIKNINIPMFFLAAADDHIVPWQSVYQGMKLIKSKDKKFYLTDSGHVAGVINPPLNQKYYHRSNDNLSLSSEEWLANSKKVESSWWIDWLAWLHDRSGTLKQDYNYINIKSLRAAPGDYVIK